MNDSNRQYTSAEVVDILRSEMDALKGSLRSEMDALKGSLRSEADSLHIEMDALRNDLGQKRERKHGRYPDADRLGALYALERVTGFGPVKFRAMHEASVDPVEAIERPDLLPFKGRIGSNLRHGIQSLSPAVLTDARKRALDQLERAQELSASILTHGEPSYPKSVYASNNPVPVLYVRGDPAIWDNGAAVAVVGSRNTREPYANGAWRFATAAARSGVRVVSGFAMGADSIGHKAAVEAEGSTVCVMPCGLDNMFPPENRDLWEELLAHPSAVFVSEFGFGQRASSLLLRKRNKLIAAFVQGIVVVQSAMDGGAMNAYRFGREQKKPVTTFSSDGSKETTGNALIETYNQTSGFNLEPINDDSEYNVWLQRLSSLT